MVEAKKTIKYYTFLLLIVGGILSSCKETHQETKHEFTNALVNETSPYLLQHAHNPVNWQAWNDDVFEEAQKTDKLVLVSVGYSSCHWCHVMEEETFEDAEVAKLMNDNFINIKVDREERPDIDQVYQTAVQLIGQNGGWPLNAITLPNGKPLYLGTYHTKEQWKEVLTNIHQQYTKDPQKAVEYADRLAAGIEETNIFEPSTAYEKLTTEALKSAVDNWRKQWDLELGGNQGQQKFPVPNTIDFLLDYAVLTKDRQALDHVENTLNKMAEGGIYDHLGGGFFRYSTDPEWKVPHFEKMLYDNAQLIGLYAKGYKVFKNPVYKNVVFETISFLEREMKNPQGGYYATLDADSEGEEGKFYIWKEEELKSVLGDDFLTFSNYYNIQPGNAWQAGNYILYTKGSEKDFLQNNKLTSEDLIIKKAKWQEQLMKARANRVRPATDDKIITSWNALLINGFIEAYQTFGEDDFLKNAISIFDFIKGKSYNKGELVHSFKEGSKRNEGFSEDYAFLIDASLKLYGATLDTAYLNFSNTLMPQAQDHFFDMASGMFKFNKNQSLISNPIKTNDGDIPSPNSVMAHNLFLLGHLNYNPEYSKRSKTMLTTILPYVTDYTDSYANWSRLLLNLAQPFYEIAVVGTEAEKFTADLQRMHIPNTLITGSSTASDLPLFEERFVEGRTYVYVCQDRVCKLPVQTVEDAIEQLKNF